MQLLAQQRDKVMHEFVDFVWMSESTQSIGHLLNSIRDPKTDWSKHAHASADDCLEEVSTRFDVLERRLERDVMDEHISRVQVCSGRCSVTVG